MVRGLALQRRLRLGAPHERVGILEGDSNVAVEERRVQAWVESRQGRGFLTLQGNTLISF